MQSFLTAVLLAGAALAVPTGTYPPPPPTTPTCTDRSIKVNQWKVKDFDFHSSYTFTTPAHQNSYGYVNFTLENAAVNYKSICTGSSSQLSDFFYGTQIYKCDVPFQGDEATFTYSRPSGELRINQTWNCADEGSRFTGFGGTKLNLKCKDTKWQNPKWVPGQIYSTRNVDCTKVSVPAPITSMEAVA